jgi:hypothetical protein
MTRWRTLIVVLVALALAGFFLFVGKNWRAALPTEFPHVDSSTPASLIVDKALADLPNWLSSVATYLTLFIFGVADLYLFPARVRKMQAALTISWSRSFHIMLAGLAFGLLFILTAISASLARVTFPLTLLTALGLFVLALWGYVALAYALGRTLLQRADWFRSPITALALGLLLLHSLIHLPFAGVVFAALGIGAGLGVVITTRFGSMQPWDLNLFLEEWKE